ncbi:MAG: hypothetical protein ACK4QW_09980 [Alphaproteobacteria bacterium]
MYHANRLPMGGGFLFGKAPETPASIAAAVPQSDDLIRVEQELAALHDERTRNIARVREREPWLSDFIEQRDAAREIRDLIMRRRVLEAEIEQRRRPVMELRRNHEVAVAAALAPLEREVAARVLAAFEALRADAAILSQIRSERIRAGGRTGYNTQLDMPATEVERVARAALSATEAR